MGDIEQQLRAAMRAAANAVEPAPDALIDAVQRRHRRRSFLLACLAVLAAIAVAIPAAIIVREITATPAPAAPQPNRSPTGLRGQTLPAGTNLQILVSTAHNQAGWYSTATRTTARITGLSGLASANFLASGRVQGGTWLSAGCVRFCGQSAFYFIADGSHTATRIGVGVQDDGVVASGHAGAVWLVTYPPGRVSITKEAGTARLVSTSGQVLGPPYHLPAGYRLVAAAGRYLLLQDLRVTSTTGPSVFVLWSPSAHRVVRTIDDALAASQDWIAWTKGCGSCQVQILNVATGKSAATSLQAGPGFGWRQNGGFTDDGSLLAYQTPDGDVDVYSIRTGLQLVIPPVSAHAWFRVGWLNGGPTLMIATGPGSGYGRSRKPPVQIAIWQPGDTALRVATVRNKAEPLTLLNWVTANSFIG
jgi:hypothetical protein